MSAILVEESCIRATSAGAIGVGDQSFRIRSDLDCLEQTDPIVEKKGTTYNCILCMDTENAPPVGWERSSDAGFTAEFLRVPRYGRMVKFPFYYTNSIVILGEGTTDRSAPETIRLNPISPKSAGENVRTLARFQDILEGWKGKLFTNTLERLRVQLSYLLADEEELNELLQVPDTKSFEALLGYLAARRWIKAPSLTLTRNGVFVANWRPAREAKARLSVDFIKEKRARWSAIDAQDPNAPTMAGGVCSVSDLDEHLRPYRGWVCL